MQAENNIKAEFERLVELGKNVKATKKIPQPGHITSSFVNVELANRWFTSSIALIQRVFGQDSVHSKALVTQFVEYPKWPNVECGFGVLLSAQDDFLNGSMSSYRKLIEAEVFDDLLEQADHLLIQGYSAPAAVIAGCVLEDALRKLCVNHGVDAGEKAKLDTMNSSLAKSGVYAKLTQKRVTTLADIRNSAAHGKWGEFEERDVENMIAEVRAFAEKYFT